MGILTMSEYSNTSMSPFEEGYFDYIYGYRNQYNESSSRWHEYNQGYGTAQMESIERANREGYSAYMFGRSNDYNPAWPEALAWQVGYHNAEDDVRRELMELENI